MDAKLLVAQPDEVVFELKVNATVKEFEMIRDDLNRAKHSISSWQLVRVLDDLLAQARKIYRADAPMPGGTEKDFSQRSEAEIRAMLDPRVADFGEDQRAAAAKLVTLNDMIFDEHGPAAPAPTYEQGIPVTAEDRRRWADEMRDGM